MPSWGNRESEVVEARAYEGGEAPCINIIISAEQIITEMTLSVHPDTSC